MPRDFGELLITLLGVLLFLVFPLIARRRNAARRRMGQPGGRPAEAERALREVAAETSAATIPAPREPAPLPAAAAPAPSAARPVPAQPAFSIQPLAQPAAAARKPRAAGQPRGRLPGLLPNRLQRLTPWQQAVALAEILGPPRGLDGEPPPR